MPLPAPVQALADLTREQVLEMPTEACKRLSEECQRVYRIIETERIVADARDATAPKSGVLYDLGNGERAG
jgi:hypothetical protein